MSFRRVIVVLLIEDLRSQWAVVSGIGRLQFMGKIQPVACSFFSIQVKNGFYIFRVVKQNQAEEQMRETIFGQ
jgi:hypothetical protein